MVGRATFPVSESQASLLNFFLETLSFTSEYKYNIMTSEKELISFPFPSFILLANKLILLNSMQNTKKPNLLTLKCYKERFSFLICFEFNDENILCQPNFKSYDYYHIQK